ncbi:MAG: beta-mannosidase [Bacteroidales bacterium]|nr:beta-mannosidase [Bacteroidales bacterium]
MKAGTVILTLVITMLSLEACDKQHSQTGPTRPQIRPFLTDSYATAQTKALWENLVDLRDKGTLFGAQIPTEYGLTDGVRWEDDGSMSRSDTKDLVGSHPAVCGWDISGIELEHEKNIDDEPFVTIRQHIVAAHKRGAVNTISWHCTNPKTMGNAWDATRAVYLIIPGGERHEMFKLWLDRVAAFFNSLKDESGEQVPLIFRPWHEHTGSGFWWGKGNASREEFVALWRFTIEYLRDTKGLHQLIWAYSPDMVHISSRDSYMEYWPGDNYVDILGLDAYDRDGQDYGHKCLQLCRLGNVIAGERAKIFALTETGLQNNDPSYSKYYNKNWWTRMLYKVISGERISFALVWRNGGLPPAGEYFNAFRGCYSGEDFIKFAALPDVLLERDLPDMYHYAAR